MSITQINDYAIGDSNLNGIMTSLDNTYKGKADITLSEYDTDNMPVVKVGSVFENNGALFVVDSADVVPTGYAGIPISTTFYLYYDATTTNTFIYSDVAPVWSDALQGWYNGNNRALFSMFKDSGGTLYEGKSSIQLESAPSILSANEIKERSLGYGVSVQSTTGEQIKTKVITATTPGSVTQIDIPHGLNWDNIVGVAIAPLTINVNTWRVSATDVNVQYEFPTGFSVTVRVVVFYV